MGFGEKRKEETKQPNEFECCRRAQNFRITGKKENKLKIVSLQFLFSPPLFFPFESSIQLTTQQF